MITFSNCSIGRNKELFRVTNSMLETKKLYTIIGKNGIGKSTFLHTINGTIPPFDGEILAENIPISNYKQNLAKLVSFVPSKFEGVEHLTTSEYIALGRIPHLNFLAKLSPSDYIIINETVEKLSLEHLKNKSTLELSDGERQLASIAKALVQQTQIILLDEPTSFLDYSNKKYIQQKLAEIAFSENKCIIQSSHDIELSQTYSDELILLNPLTKLAEKKSSKQTEQSEIIATCFPDINL
jgi:iron complex transport system ATP-binding protein